MSMDPCAVHLRTPLWKRNQCTSITRRFFSCSPIVEEVVWWRLPEHRVDLIRLTTITFPPLCHQLSPFITVPCFVYTTQTSRAILAMLETWTSESQTVSLTPKHLAPHVFMFTIMTSSALPFLAAILTHVLLPLVASAWDKILHLVLYLLH